MITWAFEVDFDRDGSYEADLTAYVSKPGSGVAVKRGMNPDGVYQVSSMTLQLNNSTDVFNSRNTSSAYYGQMTPDTPCRVTASHNSNSYTVWTGYIASWKRQWQSGDVPMVAIQCSDIAHYIVNSDAVNVGVATNRDTDGALNAILDAWEDTSGTDYIASGGRQFDDGLQDLPFHYAIGQKVMEAMMAVVRSEPGLLWVDALGRLKFEARDSRLGSTPDDTWGDGTDVFPIAIDDLTNDHDYVTSVRARTSVFSEGQADLEVFRFSRGASTGDSLAIAAGETYIRSFQLPTATTAITTPVATTDYRGNSAIDGSGTNKTAELDVEVTVNGAGYFTLRVTNTDASTVYLTLFRLRGQPVDQFYGEHPEAFVEMSVPGRAGGRGVEIDKPFAGDGNTYQLLEDAYSVLRTYRYPVERMTMTFIPSNTTARDKLLAVELGDLIQFADSERSIDELYRVETLEYHIPPDWAGQSFEIVVGFSPSYIYRNLDAIAIDLFDRANASGDLGSTTNGKAWANDTGFDIVSEAARANTDTLSMATVALPVTSKTVEWTVAASSDDAYEGAGSMILTGLSGTISNNNAVDEYSGVRFLNVGVPNGAVILDAYLSVVPTSTRDEPDHAIYGIDEDNTGTFTSATNDISSRSFTTATVTWSSADLGADGVAYFDTPDISTIVQEIVDRAGWASGNAMAFVFQGSASATRDLNFLDFDGAVSPAKLSITYRLDDQIVEVSLGAIGTGDEVGGVLRYEDADNQVRFYLDKGSNELILEKNVATTVTELASPAFTVGTAHELRAMVQDDRIRVWADFTLLIDETDASLPSGTSVGLFARNASGTTTFDNFYAQGL